MQGDWRAGRKRGTLMLGLESVGIHPCERDLSWSQLKGEQSRPVRGCTFWVMVNVLFVRADSTLALCVCVPQTSLSRGLEPAGACEKTQALTAAAAVLGSEQRLARLRLRSTGSTPCTSGRAQSYLSNTRTLNCR